MLFPSYLQLLKAIFKAFSIGLGNQATGEARPVLPLGRVKALI